MDISANRRITEGVIWKQLLIFFFPILMGSFFQQMYNTVDTIIVGRFVGTGALAAVGASGPIISLINGFFLGISSGATVILAQFYGANDGKGVRESLHTGMALALVLGLLILVVGVGFAPRILRLIGTPESCLADAVLYCRIYFSGAVASMVYNMGSGILRAMGDSKRPMFFLIACCGINIVLDLLFVCVLKLGVAGAGIATVLSLIISAGLVVYALLRQPGEERLVLGQLRLHRALLIRILKIGLPAGIQLMMFDFSNLIVQTSINSFGEAAVAAWVAFGKADGITWMLSAAFGVSVTTFVGQNFGAQRYDRVRRSVWVCMAMSVSMVGVLSLLEFTFRRQLLGLFTADPAVVEIGTEMMAQIVLFNVVFMPIEVFAGAMRGTGYALPPTLIMCLCVCLFRVIWVLGVVSRFHSISVLCMAYPISWTMCTVIFYIVYLRGNWLRGRIRDLGMEESE